MDRIPNNIYDKLLIVLILCLSIGLLKDYFLLPIYFFSAISIPLTIHELGNPEDRVIRPILFTFFIMLVYAVITLTWVPKVSDGLKSILVMGRNMALFIDVIIFMGRANNPLRSLVYGWNLVFALTAVIALWEITTGQHLSVAREVLDESFLQHAGYIRNTASVTFYNPNTYCVFMVMAFPFLLYRTSMANRLYEKMTNIVLLLLLVFIMFMNASRGGLISIGIILIVYLFFNIRKYTDEEPKRTYVALIIISLLLLLFLFYDILFSGILSRLENTGLLEDTARRILWKSSWVSFVESRGFGQGIGSMQSILNDSYINTTSLIYSHNFILELLLEGGLLYLFIFIFFLYQIFIRSRSSSHSVSKIVGYSTLLAFPFYSVINSHYIPVIFVWCFFASIYALIYYQLSFESEEEDEEYELACE